jgi:PBP1b-binding outer membrane lipoprotein LpoB
MKKVFAILVLAGLMTACNNKAKTSEEKKDSMTNSTTTTPPTDNNTTTTPPASSDIPKFADAEVQKFVDDYTAWVTAYVNAYKTKDMTKVQEYSMKASDWSQRTVTVSQKLAANPDEATKFSNYMAKLGQDIAAAMKMN